MGRVAALLTQWAGDLGLPGDEAVRWAAAGWLHDALRDADPRELTEFIDPADRDFPAPLLHGPAAAKRLVDSVDPRLVVAIRYHTIGHPSLDELGRALYLADFLEPGRSFAPEWCENLRARMPRGRADVLVEVASSRIRHLLDQRQPIRPETAAFWSSLVAVPAR